MNIIDHSDSWVAPSNGMSKCLLEFSYIDGSTVTSWYTSEGAGA